MTLFTLVIHIPNNDHILINLLSKLTIDSKNKIFNQANRYFGLYIIKTYASMFTAEGNC